MGYYTDYSSSTKYSAKDTALYNRLNGVASHSWGAVLASNAPNILSMGVSIFNKVSSKNDDITGPEPEANTESIDTTIKNKNNFNTALSKFNEVPNEENAKALIEAYEANPTSSLAKNSIKILKDIYPDMFDSVNV